MFLNCPSLDQWHKKVPTSTRSAALAGFGLLFACLTGFGAWAAMAPIEGAVVSNGRFVAAGQNKQVQHLEGGIIREVLVSEGDTVKAGQVMLRLEETSAKAKLQRLLLKKYRLEISRARLEAEINDKVAMVLPPQLDSVANRPEIQAMYRRQRTELATRRKKREAEREVLEKEIAGLKQGIIGYRAQLDAAQSRLELFQLELRDKKELFKHKLVRKTDLLALQRSEAAIRGEVGQLMGRVADAGERVARAEQQIASLRSQELQKSVEELRRVETDLDDIDEQVLAAKDVVNRTEIRAPVPGIVVKMNRNTRGGVVGAGDVILELLPLNSELILETRIAPTKISQVQVGQHALIRLTALKQRLAPMVNGRVIYLSADAVSSTLANGQSTSTSYDHNMFVVRVKLDETDRLTHLADFRPVPGMPADIYIKTEPRTFFQYLMRPVLDRLSRAFRER